MSSIGRMEDVVRWLLVSYIPAMIIVLPLYFLVGWLDESTFIPVGQTNMGYIGVVWMLVYLSGVINASIYAFIAYEVIETALVSDNVWYQRFLYSYLLGVTLIFVWYTRELFATLVVAIAISHCLRHIMKDKVR